MLGGAWTRCRGELREDLAAAFWNMESGERVLVIRMEVVAAILQVHGGARHGG